MPERGSRFNPDESDSEQQDQDVLRPASRFNSALTGNGTPDSAFISPSKAERKAKKKREGELRKVAEQTKAKQPPVVTETNLTRLLRQRLQNVTPLFDEVRNTDLTEVDTSAVPTTPPQTDRVKRSMIERPTRDSLNSQLRNLYGGDK